jgi:hypothetical protein
MSENNSNSGMPAWLDESPSAPSSQPASRPSSAAAPAIATQVYASANENVVSNKNAASNTASADPVTLQAMEGEQLRGVILFTRLINLGVSIAVIVHSVLVFISFSLSPKHWVLGAYATCGGCLICCLETQLKFFRTAIAMNFGFLFNPLFRFVYYILLATVCLSFDDIFGKILAGALAAIAFYNTYVLIKYPAYRRMRDELANEEDKRIQKRMREEVRKEATKQMFQKN